MVYSRVESLTHHTRQMKLSNAIAEAAICSYFPTPLLQGSEQQKKAQKNSYCGTKANDRKVEFTGETLTIDSMAELTRGKLSSVNSVKTSAVTMASSQ